MFTISTAAGQHVTVDESTSTTYRGGASSIDPSAIKVGTSAIVLGTTSGTTIEATQVMVVPSSSPAVAASSASQVVPFQRGTRSPSKSIGQIPADWAQGSGTIIGGSAANKATEAALAACPGGVVDRVVALGGGEYNVHYIGVNWPHQVFVNHDFQVVGAE